MRAAPARLPCLICLAVGLVVAPGCAGGAADPPNVVLLLLDTVRADRLSCYGYERPTTPHIDALCDRGIRFEKAASTSSWTLPAHASLFTGLFPIRHGATQENTHLAEGPATLAELLGARGYATFGASANPVVSEQSGLARGFDVFAETWRDPMPGPREALARHPNLLATRRFLQSRPRDRPFFLFVNYIEAHGPYRPPEPYRARFLAPGTRASLVATAVRRGTVGYYLDPDSISAAEFAVLSDLYDGEIAYLDALVGALIDELDGAGALENTLLVVTSDHGENLGDHGHFRHVFSLYGSTVRVPLIVVPPGGDRAGEVRREPVGLVDLFRTILARCGLEPPPDQAEGRDLLGELEAADEFALFAEYYYPLQVLDLFPPEAATKHRAVLGPHLRRLRSVEQGGLRLIWSSDGRHQLFDLHRDPAENANLAGSPQLAEPEEGLRALLDAYVRRGGGSPPLPEKAARGAPPASAFGDLDAESLERLRELGYVR